MKHLKHRRLLSLILALVMVVGLLPAFPVQASDADMNAAYAARESLAPVGTAFTIEELLAWTPESDPDAAYSRASIALQDRQGGFVVNDLANPEAKLMLCAYNDNPLAQGSESFFSYAFNYWQYTDSFIYWGGNGDSTEKGFIQAPTGELIDAAHTNGVPIVGVLGFPWGYGSGYVEQVSDFCQQAEDGTFPVADKLIEVMDYYGFDGWFFNQESYGCSAEIANRLNEMMRYMHELRPDIVISWYDSMINTGSVSYQDAVNDYNKFWMEADENGNWGVDEFFMNYNWYDSDISETIAAMKSIGRSQYDAFAGFNVQANVYGDRLRDYLLVDEDGLAKLSLALYYSNQTQMLASNGEEFHKTEQAYYVNAAGDPRVNNVDVSSSNVTEWAGMSRFFADKTPVNSAPFVTDFNTGHGKAWFVDGEKLRDAEWSYQSNQDVLPTFTWIIDSEGSKLEGSYDFDDAYNGGSSVKFAGDLTAAKANDILLYSTMVDVESGMTLNLTAKGGLENASLVAYLGDESTASYEACEQVAFELTAGEGWVETTADLSAYAGKTLYGIGLKVESDADVSGYQLNLGRLSILDKSRAALNGPNTLKLDDILYIDPYTAEARVQWSKVTGASSYELYKVHADGSKTFLMETPNTAYYIPSLVRSEDETDVTIEVVPVNRNGVRGKAASLTIDWLYGNDDGEHYQPAESVNVCLGATVTGYSEQGDGAECDKALDGISGNASKWWASGVGDWFSIDLGEEKTVVRLRMEHAEAGGEGKDLNTSAYTIYYKDASGNWVEAYKRTGNTDAVNDVLLDTPVTAREWKLYINGIGPSPWSAVNIYEWQMFETGYPDTEPVAMHFASAFNGEGASDTFTLTNIPAERTVKVYNAAGEVIGETAGSGTVTIEGLDFGTADAGRVYYTTTETGYGESVKFAVSFEAENAEKSEPATDVAFVEFSQPDSASSSLGSDIYTTMTVSGLSEGDVVYVLGDYAVTSQPVAEGESSVSIDRVRVVRAGGELELQVKRVGQLISDVYTVETPVFDEPTATVQVYAVNEAGETLTGVRFAIVNASGEEVAQMSTTSDSGAKADVALGAYTIRNTESPEGCGLAEDVVIDLRIEGWTSTYTVVIPAEGEDPDPTDPVDPDPTDPPEVDPSDDSRDIPLEVLTVSAGDYEPDGGASEGPAELAVDNDPATLWHTDWQGTSRENHWFQFELTADYEVDGLRYLPRTGSQNGIITEYDIQVSNDGETFTSVGTGTWELNSEWKYAAFPAEHVKYVRLVAVDAYTDNSWVFASAAEIRLTGEVYDPMPPEMEPDDSSRDIPVEVLTATAGDWQTGYEATEGPAELALDGDESTLWHTDWYGTSRENHWIQFELSESYKVDGLRYRPRQTSNLNGTITEYDIQVSDDGVTFRSVAAGTWEGNSNWKIAQFARENVKYVRLVAVDAMTDNDYVFASAAEIRLTGEAADSETVTYAVNIGELTGGTITADKARAAEGETVTLTVTPDEGFRLVHGTLAVNGTPIEGSSFVMPAENVTVTAEFEDVAGPARAAAEEAQATADAAKAAAEEAQRKAEEAQAAAEEAAASTAEDKEYAEAAQKEAEEAQAAADAAKAAAEEAQAAADAAAAAAEDYDAAAAAAAAEAAKKAQEAAELYEDIAAAKAEMAEYLKDAQKAAEEAEEERKAAEAAELARVKYEALIELALYADPDDYDAVTAAAVQAAIDAGVEAINAAETAEEVAEALENAKQAIDRIASGMPFVDVPVTSFYYDAVKWAVAEGITTGTSATTFSPDNTVTRAEAVTFLWRAAGEPAATGENPFTDVNEGAFYYEAVLWAVENGITTGLTATTFGPYATANRAQIVTFLWRAKGAEAVEAENPFTDVAEGSWYYDAVLWAVENGITTGVTAELFGATGLCNRAQMVTFLYRAYA